MRVALPVAVVLAAAPTDASAAGYYLPDSGVVAMGRGCAYVAGADGQFAQYYNPAGLVNVDRPTLSAGMSMVGQRVTFERLYADGTRAEPVENQDGLFEIPEGGVVVPLPRGLAFAFGFTSPFSPAYRYGEDGPQRYTIIDTLIWNFNVGPSLAWRPIPQLAVGAGVYWSVFRVEERLKVTTNGPDDAGLDQPTGDVAVDARVWDRFTPTWNLGVIVTPVPKLSVGASITPPVTYVARGRGELDFTGHALEPYLDQSVWRDDDIAMLAQMPLILRTGVAVRPIERVEVELDWVYEGWSSLKDIEVSDIDVTITGEILGAPLEEPVVNPINLPAGFVDAMSFRLGGAFQATPAVGLRAGGMYETSSLTLQEVSLAAVDAPKVQLGTGASVALSDGRFVLDASAAIVTYADRHITDSNVDQINVWDDGNTSIVGNGDIAATGYALGGAVRYRFGRATP